MEMTSLSFMRQGNTKLRDPSRISQTTLSYCFPLISIGVVVVVVVGVVGVVATCILRDTNDENDDKDDDEDDLGIPTGDGTRALHAARPCSHATYPQL